MDCQKCENYLENLPAGALEGLSPVQALNALAGLCVGCDQCPAPQA